MTVLVSHGQALPFTAVGPHNRFTPNEPTFKGLMGSSEALD
jgi:hypothetical protein